MVVPTGEDRARAIDYNSRCQVIPNVSLSFRAQRGICGLLAVFLRHGV